MSSSSKPSETGHYALPSYLFTKPSADVILRPSDGVEFRVHKAVLSAASDFFQDMFSLPQYSSTDSPRDLPVFPVEEDAHALNSLLRLVYPVPDPPLESLKLVTSVVAAAEKYQMEEDLSITKKAWLDCAEQHPVRAFALAYRHRWEDEVRAAARLTLRSALLGTEVEELDQIPTLAYHRLLRYHTDCVEGVQKLLENFSWLQWLKTPVVRMTDKGQRTVEWVEGSAPWVSYNRCANATRRRPACGGTPHESNVGRAWWSKSIETIFETLKVTPYGHCCLSSDFIDSTLQSASICGTCGTLATSRAFDAFALVLALTVEQKVDEVSTLFATVLSLCCNANKFHNAGNACS
jgi:hypothetical protein